MITMHLRKKSNPLNVFHRAVIAIQALIAGNDVDRFALVLSSGSHGWIYTKDGTASDQIARHEAYHVHQAMLAGGWLWRWRYITSRQWRLMYEAQAYAYGFKAELDIHAPFIALDTIRRVAPIYWFGEITTEDAVLIVTLASDAILGEDLSIEIIDESRLV